MVKGFEELREKFAEDERKRRGLIAPSSSGDLPLPIQHD